MKVAGTIAFLLLIVIGLFPGVATFVLPAWHLIRTRDWQPVPCEVTTSDFTRWNGFTTFSVAYRYSVDDRPYRGTAVYRELYQDDPLVRALSPGTACTAYADAAEPRRSTLDRSMRNPGPIVTIASILFLGLAVAGAYGIYRLFR